MCNILAVQASPAGCWQLSRNPTRASHMLRAFATGRLAALSRRPPLRRRGSNPIAGLAEQTACLRCLLHTLSDRSSGFHGRLC